MIQSTNSWSCPVRLLSPFADKNECSSSLDPLFDAEGGSGPFRQMFSTGRYSLGTPFVNV